MGDGVMCAFARLDDALEAALEMQRRVGPWCEGEGIDPPLVLKLGVHAGPVIAMTANGRLDYFGRTVNLAARLGAQSRGGDIVLLGDVYDRAPAASGDAVEQPFTTRLRGLDSEQRLVRLTVDQGRVRTPGRRDHAAA